MNIVFSIVNHNHEKYIYNFLKTLDKNLRVLKSFKLHIIITNNLKEKKWYFNSIKFTISEINNHVSLGFGQNHNKAFKNLEKKCDFFCIVNPDTYFFEKLDVKKIFLNLKKNKIYSPLILNEDKTVADFFRKDIGIFSLLQRKLFKRKKEDIKNYDWLAGVFLIFNYKLYNKLKGFDERFFMYVEDCDICFRARKKGYKLKILENFKIIHVAQRNSQKSLKYFFWHLKSLFYYFFKKTFIIKVVD